jgi:two-component sensor histidine kinase
VARSTYNADIGLYWYETETYTVTVNGRTETRTRQKRHTEWHDLSGSHVKVYSNHLVSGSRGLPEAEAIPVALTANELLTNAIKHGSKAAVILRVRAGAADVTLEIISRGALREGFDLASVPSGASGLGLVRALLPRRAAEFTLKQVADEVVARVLLRPPAVRKDG